MAEIIPVVATVIVMNSMAMTMSYKCLIDMNQLEKQKVPAFIRNKSYLFDKKDIGCIFKGSVPILVDTDKPSRVMRGNALWNFYIPGPYDLEGLVLLRDLLEDKTNFIEGFEPSTDFLARSTYCYDGDMNKENNVMVFPNLECNSAVAKRIIKETTDD